MDWVLNALRYCAIFAAVYVAVKLIKIGGKLAIAALFV